MAGVQLPVSASLGRFREWMTSQGLEAVVVTRPVSIAYLAGFSAHTAERLMALTVAPDRATLLVPALERQNAEAVVREAAVVSWADGQDPYRLLAGEVGRVPRLGVEKNHLTLAGAERLQAATGATELLDCGAHVRRLRAIKSPPEVELMERAAAITDQVTEQVLSELRPGLRERDVARIIGDLIAAAGGEPAFDCLVQAGANSAIPHHAPGDTTVGDGDLLLLDFGAAFGGYCADITRMAVAGEAGRRQREVYAAVLEAHDRALEAVRPGITAGEVDEAARSVLAQAGLADRFIHRVGHGLGLEAHEDPSLDPGSERVLEAGMVITIEPGAYLPGWGGVRIEDDVLVEAAGARRLTTTPHELHAF